MILKVRADFFQIQPVHIIHKHHRVGVAHGNAGHVPSLAGDLHRALNKILALCRHGNQFRAEFRRAHAHPHGLHLAVFHLQLQLFHAAAGFHGQFGFVRHAVVIYILCNAADTVAAHFAVGAVCVVHIHFEIGHVGAVDTNQTVCADAEMTVRHPFRQSRAVRDGLFQAVHVNIIVSAALHFGKFHRIPPLLTD